MTLLLFLIAALFAGLCVQNTRLGLLVLSATLPSYLLRFELLGIPGTLLELLIIVFLLVWLVKNRRRLDRLFHLPKWLGLSLVLFLGAGIIGVVVSPETMAALGVLKAYLVEPVALFLIIRMELMEHKFHSEDLFKAFGIGALVLSLVACVQWITSSGIPIPWDIERRVTGLFDYPNALGLFLGPVVVIAAAKIHEKTQQLFWILVLIFSSIAIILAQSEAAILAALATLILAGLTLRHTRKTTIGIVLVALLVILLSPWKTVVFQKLTLQDYSGGVRLSQWSETVEMLKDNWLFGAGLSGYPTVLEPYHEATHFEIFQYPHNVILNVWTELGLLGLVAVGLLGIIILKRAQSKQFSKAGYIALLALIEMSIHGLVDVPYFKNDLAVMTWILIAITLAYACQSPDQKRC